MAFGIDMLNLLAFGIVIADSLWFPATTYLVLLVLSLNNDIAVLTCFSAHCVLQKNMEWSDWHTTVLQERNTIENVYRWACGYGSLFSDSAT